MIPTLPLLRCVRDKLSYDGVYMAAVQFGGYYAVNLRYGAFGQRPIFQHCRRVVQIHVLHYIRVVMRLQLRSCHCFLRGVVHCLAKLIRSGIIHQTAR